MMTIRLWCCSGWATLIVWLAHVLPSLVLGGQLVMELTLRTSWPANFLLLASRWFLDSRLESTALRTLVPSPSKVLLRSQLSEVALIASTRARIAPYGVR
jgi:hypothetical protein